MTGLVVVQTAANAYNHLGNGEPDCRTAHFASAPTNGNLLIAMCGFTNPPTAASGWTEIPGARTSGSFGGVTAYFKYAGVGESTSQIPTAVTQTFGAIGCWEISGVTGSIGTDLVACVMVGNTVSASTNFTTGSYATTRNNSMVLAMIDGENGIAYATPAAMVAAESGTLVADDHIGAASPGPSGTSMVMGHYVLVAALGTNVSESTSTANTSFWGYGHIELASAPASQDGHATGPIGNIVLGGVAGAAGVNANATGLIGNIVLGGVAGHASGSGSATGTIGNIVLGGVAGSAAVTSTGRVTQFPLNALAFNSATARLTQDTLLTLAKNTPVARNTQSMLNVLGKNNVNARAIQMTLLVLAKGGEPPIRPNPLSLQDAGRDMVVHQRLVNMYAEPTPQGPSDSARFQRGGLYQLASRSAGPIRGILGLAGFTIVVSGGSVWSDNDNIGVVSPNGMCVMDRSEDEIVIISNSAAYSVSDPTFGSPTVTQNSSSAFPAEGVSDVAYSIGRFIYIDNNNSGIFRWSDEGDSLTVQDLSFATVEGSPVKLMAVWVLNDEVAFFTAETVEWWYASGDPNAPWYPSTGRKYNRGLAAIRSIELMDNSLIWLGDDRIVYRSSQSPERISNFDVEDRLRRCLDSEIGNVSGHGAEFGGHKFYVINIPGHGSWAYDFSDKTWGEWRTWNRPQYRVNVSDDTFRIYGDLYSGKLMGLDGGLYTDLGDPIERIVSTYLPIKSGSPTNFNLALSCMRGVGLTAGQYGDTPIVEMRYTDHEEGDFSDWIAAPLGEQGDRGESAKALWEMLGGLRPPGRLYEFRCTDPVRFTPYEVRVNEERL